MENICLLPSFYQITLIKFLIDISAYLCFYFTNTSWKVNLLKPKYV